MHFVQVINEKVDSLILVRFIKWNGRMGMYAISHKTFLQFISRERRKKPTAL